MKTMAKAYEIWFSKKDRELKGHFVLAVPVDWTLGDCCAYLGIPLKLVDLFTETAEMPLEDARSFCEIRQKIHESAA